MNSSKQMFVRLWFRWQEYGAENLQVVILQNRMCCCFDSAIHNGIAKHSKK